MTRMKQEEKRLESEIAELLKQAERTDRKEDQEYGSKNRGDEVPEELSAARAGSRRSAKRRSDSRNDRPRRIARKADTKATKGGRVEEGPAVQERVWPATREGAGQLH
jgi:hypothetical protein